MTHIIAHTDAEAKGFREGGITLVVEPCKDQPVGQEYAIQINGKWYMGRMRDSENAWREMSCPYLPGEIVVVKEACYIAPPNFCDTEFENKTDRWGRGRYVGYARKMDADAIRCAEEFGVRRTPARWMPLWAIDTRIRILTVEARLVGSITYDEAAEAMPLITTVDTESSYYEVGDMVTECPVGAFKADWHRRHPKHPFERTWAWYYRFQREGV